jgi:hypothetical protein
VGEKAGVRHTAAENVNKNSDFRKIRVCFLTNKNHNYQSSHLVTQKTFSQE